MKRTTMIFSIFLAAALFTPAVPAVHAQDDMKGDKTGTNPVNFTYDARIYNEYSWLNTAGDGSQNVTTLEFRAPFAAGKWQFRVRARYSFIEADFNDDGVDDVDESGLGDVDFRFLTVPYLDMSKKLAFAVGLETFLDTASEDALGSGAYSFGFLYYRYAHRIDLFFLKQSADKQRWVLLDPQIILDYEEEKEFMIIDAEIGTMLDQYFGTKGHSGYLRPSVGVFEDRPTDGSIEVGYKIIW